MRTKPSPWATPDSRHSPAQHSRMVLIECSSDEEDPWPLSDDSVGLPFAPLAGKLGTGLLFLSLPLPPPLPRHVRHHGHGDIVVESREGGRSATIRLRRHG